MVTLSYTITPRIRQELLVIDELRTYILTTAIPPLSEAQLRWSASGKSFMSRSASDIIRQDWTGNPHPIQDSDIERLASVAFPKRVRSLPETRHLLRFFNTAKDHPVIVAGVTFAVLHDSPIGLLLFRMYLAKSGCDCRGMLAFLPSWDQTHGRHMQYTIWLEAYTTSFRHSCETLSASIRKIASGLDTPHPSWHITTRQKQILESFDLPTATITNREASRRFRISQVTASRDLAHLSTLGLLYIHGKGRSVYYTKL